MVENKSMELPKEAKETLEKINEYYSIRDKITIALRNAKYVGKDVWKKPLIADIVVVLRVILNPEDEQVASFLASNDLVDTWIRTTGIAHYEIVRVALDSTIKIMGSNTVCVNDFLGIGLDRDSMKSPSLFAVTTTRGSNGAVALVYPDFAKTARTLLGLPEKSAFYVIPSSIHEVLIFSTEDPVDVKEFCEIIREVNSNPMCMPTGEQLSGCLLKIDEEDELVIA